MPRQGFGALLSDAQWAHLLKPGIHRRFDDADVIIRQGDPTDTVFLIVEGTAKVTVTRPGGEDVFLTLRGPGEVLGEFAALSGLARSATVIACSGGCRVQALSGPQFRLWIRRLSLEQALWHHMVARQQESDALRADIIALPARRRVASALLRLATLLGIPTARGAHRGAELRLGLSQQELGQWIGLSRSSVAAEYKHLRDAGIIIPGRRSITIVDIAQLRRAAHSDP